MPNLDRDLLRRLAAWDTGGAPVYSLYLNVDGRHDPKAHDYLVRAQELCRRMGERATAHVREQAAEGAIRHDTGRMMLYLEREFERGPVRGLAIFSCAKAGLWEVVRASRPLPDRAAVAEEAYLLPLEVLLETSESLCTVLLDRARARVFRSELGRIEEQFDLQDEVPKHHEQGGWMQSRLQRHADEVGERHLRHTSEVLLARFRARPFDHLILAGSEDVVAEFERTLHDYLRRRVVGRETLPMSASPEEVLARSMAIEDRLEEERERRTVERVLAGAAGGASVTGLAATLEALGAGRVETLVVKGGVSEPGVRCSSCARLAAHAAPCPTCGGQTRPVPDVVESAVGAALRQGSRVEVVTAAANGSIDIGALLRF